MMSPEENARLCDIEPGAAMHEAFKRYWLPFGLSSDVAEADSDPVRVTMLGEDYVMFRDTAGQVAVMREQCCHRGASLCLGRVEHGGIRCIYHGWKFAADGAILEMPNCEDERFLTRYRQPAYPVREAGGMIWAYLGPKEKEPPLPRYPFFEVPTTHVNVNVPVFDANYMQVMEGGLDSSHLGVLHSDVMKNFAGGGATATGLRDNANLFLGQLAPRLEVQEEEFGIRYAAIRDTVGPDGTLQSVARVTAFALPSVCFLGPDNAMLLAAPVNNGRTHFYHIFWRWDSPYTPDMLAERKRMNGLDDRGVKWFGLGRQYHDLPGVASRANNWLQDRQAMREGRSFTGIVNFVPEDAAVTASAGPIYDRRYENLVPADLGLARVRRVLLDNARRIAAGEEARGLNPSPLPRPAVGVITPDQPWQALPYRKMAAGQEFSVVDD